MHIDLFAAIQPKESKRMNMDISLDVFFRRSNLLLLITGDLETRIHVS